MNWIHAIILGIVEGVTEFLPISSTGHLTLVEKLLGYQISDPGITAFTAVIQVPAMLAAIIYFWSDIVRMATAWFKGLTDKEARSNPDYQLGWAVIAGTLVTGSVAFLLKDLVTGPLRSMWFLAGALILWSVAMFAADRLGKQNRGEESVTWKDGLIIGLMQCISLVPGVSRSGATMSAGLFLGLDRVSATRLGFFLGIPTLVAAGGYEAASEFSHVSNTVGWGPMGVGMVFSFIVAYVSIAWLLKFVSTNDFRSFVIYRVLLGVAILGLLAGNVITPN